MLNTLTSPLKTASDFASCSSTRRMRPAGSIIQTFSGSSTPMLMAISVIPQRFAQRHGCTLKRMLKKETTKRHAMGLHLTADPTVIFKDLNLVKTEDDL